MRLGAEEALHDRRLLFPAVVEAEGATELLEAIARVAGEDLGEGRLLRGGHGAFEAFAGAAVGDGEAEAVGDGEQLGEGEVGEDVALGGHGRGRRYALGGAGINLGVEDRAGGG